MAGGDLKLSGASAEIHHEEPWVVDVGPLQGSDIKGNSNPNEIFNCEPKQKKKAHLALSNMF